MIIPCIAAGGNAWRKPWYSWGTARRTVQGKGIERFARIAWQVRKVRNNGSAALALAYIACGRFDAYVESVISIWDVAAGVLLVEAAGGKVVLEPKEDNPEQFAIVAWNGRIPIMEALGE